MEKIIAVTKTSLSLTPGSEYLIDDQFPFIGSSIKQKIPII